MGTVVPNIGKGKGAQLATLPAANDALLAILLKSSGLVADSALIDYASVSTMLAGASDECDFTSYARATLTSVTVTVDTTNDRTDVDADDPSFTAGSAQATGKIVVAYDPDTTGGTDADLIPIYADDFVMTTPTGTISHQFPSGGFWRAS